MKSAKVSWDFSDRPDVIDRLRLEAARQGTTQKAIVTLALESYLSHRLENERLLHAAGPAFAEWDNEEDRVYDDL